MARKTIFSYVLLLLFASGALLIFFYQQDIRDWWYLRNYQPTEEVEQYANATNMNDHGRNLFYIGDPQINDKSTFNDNCKQRENSLVLGCYDGTQIFILDINDERLEGVEEVTAAHEMLHVAYERLSASDKSRINELLESQYDTITDQRVIDTMNGYVANDPSSFHNELHSIIPTEVSEISSELEEYYRQYFNDRSVVLSAFNNYASVFSSIKDQIAAYDAQLTELETEINRQEALAAQLRTELDSERAQLDALLAEGKVAVYNSRVPSFNNLVSQHNQVVNKLQSDVSTYNTIVEERNAIALTQQELVNSLDSQTEEIN
jgi:Skp family chaperone for outer membrane proteins